MAALAVIMTLAFSSLGLARDHDDDDHWRRDRQHDKDRDHDRWRDHERHEQWEREHRGWWHRDHDRDDWRWRDRDDRYRGGYGYPSGGWYGYPSGGYGYPSGGYGYPAGGYYGNNGYNIGYQDGSYQARKDMAEHKPFNPYPRGDSHGTHGYSGYGDINAYRSQYTSGYRSGYESNFRGGYRGWGF